jgi:hypothetical protein
MCRRVWSILLIVGWISLSGFDLLEDLDEVEGQAAVSKSYPNEAAGVGKRGGWGPLANNVIEFAHGTEQGNVAFLSSASTAPVSEQLSRFRPHVHLHKLYRVLLI